MFAVLWFRWSGSSDGFFQGSGVSDVLQRGGFSDVVAVTWFQWSGFGDDFSVEWCR